MQSITILMGACCVPEVSLHFSSMPSHYWPQMDATNAVHEALSGTNTTETVWSLSHNKAQHIIVLEGGPGVTDHGCKEQRFSGTCVSCICNKL